MANRFTTIKADAPLNIIVANLAKELVELPRGITVGYAIQQHPAELYLLRDFREDFP